MGRPAGRPAARLEMLLSTSADITQTTSLRSCRDLLCHIFILPMLYAVYKSRLRESSRFL